MRLLALLAVVMMLLTVSGPAMAQEWDDGFWWGDLWCWDIGVNLIACSDGGIYEEVDSWDDADDDWTWGDEEEDTLWPPSGETPWNWDDEEE